MSQRIMLTLTAAMAVVCVAAFVVTGIVIQQSRAAISAAIAESRTANEALRARLEQVSAAASKPIDWKPPLKIQLVLGEKDGPPAADFKVILRHSYRAGESGLEPIAEHQTGPDGEIDFGPLRPVDYVLNVYAPWEEVHQRTIDHRPGDARTEQVVCPAAPAEVENARISVSIDWPDDLRAKQPWAICSFSPDNPYPRRNIAADTWTAVPKADGVANWLIVQPHGRLREQTIKINPREDLRQLYFPFKDPMAEPEGHHGFRVDQRRRPPRFFFGVDAETPELAEVQWPAITYRLGAFAVGIDVQEAPEDGVRKLDVPGLLSAYRQLLGRAFETVRTRSGSGTIPGGGFLRNPDRTEALPAVVTIKPEDRPLFEAISGAPNHWKITLPDELLTHVRERLAKE